MRDYGSNPEYRLTLYEDGQEDSAVLTVDVESLRQGGNLPENAYVRLSDVALFFLSRTSLGFMVSFVPWINGEGNSCRVSNAEEALEGKARYIEFQEAKAIINRALRADPPTEEEIAFWLGTGMLTAWEHEYANACPVDCQKQNHGGLFVRMPRPEEECLPEQLSSFANIIHQLDNFYFLKSELDSLKPKTRWRSYDYVLTAATELGFTEAEINRLAWNSPIGRLRQFYLIENSLDSLDNPRSETALQPVEAYLRGHLYPSGWIMVLMDKLAKGRGKDQPFRPAGFSLAAKPEEYANALKQDSWAIWEALCWLNGDNPFYYRRNVKDDYPIEVDLIERAVKAGILTPESTPPLQWIEWATSKGWAIPEPLRIFQEASVQRPQEDSGPYASTPPDPRRVYPQAFGIRVTVAEMRERWGLLNNKYLDELAHTGDLIPFYRDNLKIEIKPKGLGCEFGIPPDAEWSEKGSMVFDAEEIVWVQTLPDDAYYGLPFVLEYEDKYPQVRPTIKQASALIVKKPNDWVSEEIRLSLLLQRSDKQMDEVLAELANQAELDMSDVLFLLEWNEPENLKEWSLSRFYEIDRNGIRGRLAPDKTRLEFPCTPFEFINWCKEEEDKRDKYGLKLHSLLDGHFVQMLRQAGNVDCENETENPNAIDRQSDQEPVRATPEAPEKRQIYPMEERENKDDWFLVIRDAAGAYEREFGYTPSATELWSRLKQKPPKGYEITWNTKNKSLDLGGKMLDREAFGKRYKRYWPTAPKK